jgi:hypothetical protein
MKSKTVLIILVLFGICMITTLEYSYHTNNMLFYGGMLMLTCLLPLCLLPILKKFSIDNRGEIIKGKKKGEHQ